MSTVQTGDTIAVYRSGTLYKAPADMSTLQDTDIIVVGRGNTPYKCTFADWKASQTKPPAIASVTLADSPEAGRFTSGTFRSTVVMTDEGIPASTKGIKAYVEGTLKSAAQTSAITKATPTTAPGGFAAVTYTGNGGTQSITGLPFSPDLVWLKVRSAAYSHALFDVVRGTGKFLESSRTGVETTSATSITAFNSDGFSLGSEGQTNQNSQTFVAWAWDAGNTTVTNTQGSITSSCRTNASAGFSIVSYTGTGATATVGHGLGVAPSLIIAKPRSAGGTGWTIYHRTLGKDQFLQLQATNAAASFSGAWGSAEPTSTVFGLGAVDSNSSGATVIAYCFAPVAGFSSFGQFTGGSAVNCGFQPKFVLAKRTDSTGDWEIVDNKRGTNALKANLNGAEAAATIVTGLTATGFTTTGTGNYIYAAFNDNLSTVDLEFTNNTQLANFTAGDAVTEVGGSNDGIGTVSAVNAAATPPTMKLAAPGGTWDVGSAVKGPLKTQIVTTTPNSDEIVAVGGTAGAPILTFKTDKDLAKFAAGDALRQDSAAGQSYFFKNDPANNWTPPSDPSFLFDGDESTRCEQKSPYMSNNWEVELVPPIPVTELKIKAADTNGAYFYVNGNATTKVALSGHTGDPYYEGGNIWNVTPLAGGMLTRLTFVSTAAGSACFAYAVYVNGSVLNISPLPTGTVGSINTTAKTMTLTTSTGTWGPVNAGHYVIGPTKTGPAANVKLFCKLNAGLTVTDLQSADPGFTAVTGAGPYTVTFPATLPSGNPPDTDLPAGTHLVTEVQATNSSRTVTKASNTVTPA